MKKKLSITLAVAFVLIMIIGSVPIASASVSLSMSIGQSEPLEISNRTITNANSSNSSVVSVYNISGGKAYVTAKQAGSATVTVNYTENGMTKTYDFVITVNSAKVSVNLASAGDFDISSKDVYSNVNYITSSDDRVCKAAFVSNMVIITATGAGNAVVSFEGYRNGSWESVQIQVNVGSSVSSNTSGGTSAGEDIRLDIGGTWTSQSIYETISVRSENENVAKIVTDSTGRNTVTGMGQGSTTITYTYRNVANGPLQSVSHNVAVSDNSSNSSSSNSSTQDVALLVANSYNTARYNIISAVSNNTSVAQVTVTGSVQSGATNMNLRIQGMAVGRATITMECYDSATSAKSTLTYNVTVTDSSNSSGNGNTTTSQSSNISFSKTGWTVAKYNSAGSVVPYRVNPRVNGVAVEANTMLWLSSDPSIMTVESTTGIFRGVKAGSARLICVDKTGLNMAYATITVTN